MSAGSAHPTGGFLSQTRPYCAWYVVIVPMLANTVSYLDRQILNPPVEPIKADPGLSDTQIAAVQGTAFAIFCATMRLPIARVADLTSRKRIVSLGAACWSVATVGWGLARTFSGSFAARVMVGVGESSLSPAAYSMVSDLFPRHRMAKPMGVIAGGIFAGAGLAYMAGGHLIEWAHGLGGISLPGIGAERPVQIPTNAGVARVQGLEAELSYAANGNRLWMFNPGYTDARCTDVGRATSIDRNSRFRNTPELSWSGSAQRSREWPNGVGLAARVNYGRVDGYCTETLVNRQLRQHAYGLLNARLVFETPSENMRVTAFGDNLTHSYYLLGGGVGGPIGTLLNYAGRPREYGVTVDVFF